MAHLDFEAAESVECSDDGERFILWAEGEDGRSSISFPMADLMRIVALMMQASQGQPWQGKVLRAMHVRELRLRDNPEDPSIQLLITLHTGAAPLALSLKREQFRDLAVGYLETTGFLPATRHGPSQ